MRSYKPGDISKALMEVGVKKGDCVFFIIRVFSLGKMEGCKSKEDLNQSILNAIFGVIGEGGTLVVPTYSQQIGRFGLPYIHEETPTLTGIFSEYVRTRPQAVRSFHPVFSLTAIGCDAKAICGNVGTNAFGIKSAYDFLFKHGGHSICLGFEYERGDIVTGAHYVECTYGVPYYYNKIVKAEAYKDGKRSKKVFTINVGYREFGVRNKYLNYVDAIRDGGLLKSYPVGDGILYSNDLKTQLEVGYDLLSEDVYAFLEEPPQWEEGKIPYEGPEETLDKEKQKNMNWEGFHLHRWGQV